LKAQPPTTLQLPREANSKASVCARAALRHEELGEFDRAVESLLPFWGGPGYEPQVADLNAAAAAAILLRAGSLTAWVGSQRQVEGWQEKAKDLLTRSADAFASLGDFKGQADAEKHLGTCYWRAGAFSEARIVFSQAIARVGRGGSEWMALQLDHAMVDFSEGAYRKCLEVFASLEEAIAGAADLLKARFHNGRGIAHKRLGENEAAIIELTAAAYYLERAGHERNQLITEINLGVVMGESGQFREAHDRLNRADRLAARLRDRVHLAHSKDSRARVYLAEKNYEAAEAAARESVGILERGDEYALLVDSLLTQARVLARLKDPQRLGVYARAHELAVERVGTERAAAIALELLGELAGDACVSGCLTLEEAKHAFESSILRVALSQTNTTTEAALKLGMPQQTLSWILQNHHPELKTKARKPRRLRLTKRRHDQNTKAN
jgi:tetratricopeptide (TPR) repeat protein